MMQSSKNRNVSFKREFNSTNFFNNKDLKGKDIKARYKIKRIMKTNNAKQMFQNINLSIKKISYKNITKVILTYSLIIDFLILISIIPNVLNKRLFKSFASSVILKIKGTGSKTYYNRALYENCISINNFPDEVYINDAKLDLPYNEYTFTRSNNKIELIFNGDITNLNCFFADCSSINEMDFSKFDTSKVTTMIGMFWGCSGLKSLDLSNFNTKKVTIMDKLFINCHSLFSLNLSSFDTSQTTSIDGIFESCLSLEELDLSNFKTSNIKSMETVFFECESLKFINLSNFDTSNVETMYGMFYKCYSLTSMDLSNFKTPKLISIGWLFGQCISLISVNLSSFNTINVNDMEGIFYNNTSLKSLDLSNFKTSKVTTMESMFYGCSKLTFLNLSNFEIPKVTNMDNMFFNCTNLEYINLGNAYITLSTVTLNNIFKLTKINLVLCSKDSKIIEKLIENKCAIVDCSENWREKRKKIIIENNTCVDDCSTVINTFEYNSKCYNNCPSGKYKHIYFDTENNYYIECINSIEGYYLDEEDSFYKPCYPICKTCSKKGNKDNHNCNECKENYFHKKNFLNYYNCYNDCLNYKYYDYNLNQFYCTDILECPSNYNKLILDKRECVDDCKKDLYYKFEYMNECFRECPNGTFNNSFHCEIITYTDKQEITTSLNNLLIKTTISENNVINTNEKNALSDLKITVIINKNKKVLNVQNYFNISIEKETEEDIYHETQTKDGTFAKFISTKYMKKHFNSNQTTINLGLCEDILKKANNISDNESLYILLFDVREEGMKIPKIEYEVFNIINEEELILLNLSICQNMEIEISIPVNINNNSIDFYNSSSGYYNDFCYILTTEDNTDICLKDRRREFIDKNVTLCEENCKLIDYDYIYSKAKCSCEIKINFPLLDEVKFDKEKLKNNFIDINNVANIQFLKCYKIVFKKENIIKNIGFYILAFIFLLFFICLILFYSKFYDILRNDINKLCTQLKNNNKNNKSIIKLNNNNKNKNIIKLNNNNNKNIIKLNNKNNNLKGLKKVTKSINNNRTFKPIILKKKIKVKKKKKFQKKINNIQTNYNNRIFKNLKNNNSLSKRQNLITNTNKAKKPKRIYKKISYIDSELNSLTYENALKHDKRTFIQCYISFLKLDNLFLFSFFPFLDYNSRIIKMFLFFFYFSTHFAVSAVFYSDSTMHKIYEDKGSFDFIYQIPQIIYSSIISVVINGIVKYLSLSEKSIIKFKQESENNTKKIDENLKKLLSGLKVKFVFFFIFAFIFLLIFWYYITCFCGIYINTQIHLIKDALFSFLMSLIYPFGLLIFPVSFRILALRAKAKDKKYVYKFSKFLEIL